MVKYIHTQKIGDDELIWRYMDFVSFYSLITNKALFFRRLDKYSDEFEGTIPEETKMTLDYLWMKYGIKEKSERDEMVSHYFPNLPNLKMTTLANSWTASDNESYAMWKIFLRNSSEGIAIKTTTGRLKEALSINDTPIILGKVTYEPLGIAEITDVRLATNKRKAYRYENEFRAVMFNQSKSEKLPDGNEIITPLFEVGTSIAVDLNKLVDEIYISPFCAPWFYDIVESVIRTQGPQGLSLTIRASEIKDK